MSDGTAVVDVVGHRSERFAALFVMAVAAAVILPLLGATGFFDPWETNYAEVAREMVVRDDYLYPYWKNAHFFSKPVLLFWLTAPLYRLLGADGPGPMPVGVELAGRLPSALLGLLTVVVLYAVARRVWPRRAAVLGALVLATTPYWAFLSRQAITDMPYAALMSIALLLLAPHIVGDGDERAQLRATPLPTWLVALVGACLLPQAWEVCRTGAFFNRVDVLGSEHTTRLVVGVAACGAVVAGLAWLKRHGRDPLVVGAALALALSTLAKGPVGAALAGVIVVVTIVLCDGIVGLARHLWRREVAVAIAIFFAVAAPWPLVMIAYDGLDDQRKTWFQRFVLYDLLGRVGAGVHGDRGGVEYYVRSLALGMLPWAGFVPIALVDGLRALRTTASSREDRLLAFATVWACGVFLFFTLATTKFHHYALPFCVPAALLLGHTLHGLADSAPRAQLVVCGWAAIVGAIVVRELAAAPHEWIDLFTYHYKGYKPEYYFPVSSLDVIDFSAVGGQGVSAFVLVPAVFGALAVAAPALGALWQRSGGTGGPLAQVLDLQGAGGRGVVVGAVVGAVVLSIVAVQVVVARASQHWSQRGLIETYSDMRQGDEPLIAYQMDWKGETFYSKNSEFLVAKNAGDLRLAVGRPGREFVLVQTDRLDALKTAIGRGVETRLRVVDRSNVKWLLLVVD